MFDRKIRDIQNEILTLKNLKEKSAMVLRTMEVPFTLTFNIIEDSGGYSYYADKTAVIKISADGTDPFTQIYFDVNDFDYRTLFCRRYIDENTGDYCYYVTILDDQNATDIQKIQQGQTVTINYSAKLVSTSVSTITTTYINWYPVPPMP